MKSIAALLIFWFLLFSCSKRDYPSAEKQKEENQEVLSQEIHDQETQKPGVSYVY
jgi:PBP1b-binding outer membrane lipoprotein LpoB